MFCNVENQLDDSNVRQILATSMFNNSLEHVNNRAMEYRNNNWFLYGWMENDTIVGVCGFEVCNNGYLEILNIAVAENARGRGIGSAMILALRDEFHLPIKAETDDDAVDFYRKVGFESTEFQKRGFRRWKCVLQ